MSGKKIYLIIVLLLLAACGPAETENQSDAPAQEATDEVAAAEIETEHEEDNDHDDDHDADNHDEDEHREHDAHEHGVAELTVAWSGQDLLIDLDTPGFNVLGFEYEPSSDAEKTLFAESMAALESGAFLSFNTEAACTLLESDANSVYAEHAEHDHDDEAEHDDEADHDDDEAEHEGEAETHTDIEVAYSVRCENPAELSTLDLSGLFAQFPNFAELRVQWVSDTAQSAQDLTPVDAVLELR